MNPKSCDVLLLTGATGLGHVRVAESIATDLRETHGLSTRTLCVYRRGGPVLGILDQAYSLAVHRTLGAYDILWSATNGRVAMRTAARVLYGLARTKLREALVAAKPRAVVVTHPLFLTRWVEFAASELSLAPRTVVFVSDIANPHAAWSVGAPDRLCVAADAARTAMESHGMDAHRLVRTTFPIDRRLLKAPPPSAARAALGLDQSTFTVLVTGGGNGAGPMVEAIDAVRVARANVQFLWAGGKRGRDPRAVAAARGAAVIEVSRSEDMLLAYGACDVVVGKAGPSTIFESRAAQRPMVALSEIGRQEVGNGQFLERSGGGVWCPDLAALPAAITRAAELRLDRAQFSPDPSVARVVADCC